MVEILKRLLKEEDGQGITEYALIIVLIVIAAIAVVLIFKDQIREAFEKTLKK